MYKFPQLVWILENMKCMCFLAAQQDELHAELGEESDTLSEESSPQPLGEAIARPSPPPESDGETGNPHIACGGHVVVAIVPPTPSILIHSCRCSSVVFCGIINICWGSFFCWLCGYPLSIELTSMNYEPLSLFVIQLFPNEPLKKLVPTTLNDSTVFYHFFSKTQWNSIQFCTDCNQW